MWDQFILNPLINITVILSHILFGSFGLTIIVLTVIIRVLTFPLTLKQLRVSKSMQGIQAQMTELRSKYAKDKQKLAEEQMKLYKQSGMNPLGCILPMAIQMPVWIALYQAIIRVLAVAPEDFLSLSRSLYSSWPLGFSLVPLESRFLWLDLAAPDRLIILPILVGASMWVQQKMTTVQSTDPQQQSQSQMMLWMMPIMFAFLTLQFPSGLALYWAASNIIGIVMQYFVTGWGGLVIPGLTTKKTSGDKKIKGQPVRQEAKPVEPVSLPEGVDDGKPIQRQDRGGSNSNRPGSTRRKQGGGGSQHNKRG
ncbi:MAG: YidC/Oxa1 family membrane protein insertase [Dehalococcoidales bacterium]|nr:YidC/Oxa1 family membrane protein insertase [Dehalococcoidales bacterium]